jgi:hypothetical protein
MPAIQLCCWSRRSILPRQVRLATTTQSIDFEVVSPREGTA